MLEQEKNQNLSEVQENEGENIFTGDEEIDLGGEEEFGDFTDADPGFNPFAGSDESDDAADSEPPQASKGMVSDEQEDSAQTPKQTITADDSAKKPVAELPVNPFEAALSQAEEKQAQDVKIGLVAKAPVFEYAGVKEEIVNSSITFEALRSEKSADFPELDDEKRVTWSVTYGKITKTVADAKKSTIAKMKSEIETSKEFLEALKKSKGDVICVVTPKVTAQKKGEMPVYKGVFTNLSEAEKSGKPIVLIPSEDGNIYEVRFTPIGRFAAPTGNARGLNRIKAGLVPALPPLPFYMLSQIISFFKSLLHEENKFEALANIYWDTVDHKYYIHIPKQIVSNDSVDAKLNDVANRFVHVMDIHSHNTMKAQFSMIDDDDEKATRIYAVIGRLDKYFPEISVRISVGGKYVPIEPSLVFDGIDGEFPELWTRQVELAEKKDVRFL